MTNLTTIFLNPQSPSPTSGGLWTFLSGPQTLTISNDTINTNGVAPGVYTFRYTIDNGCDIETADYTLTVRETPVLQSLQNFNFCVVNGNIYNFNGIPFSALNTSNNQPFSGTSGYSLNFSATPNNGGGVFTQSTSGNQVSGLTEQWILDNQNYGTTVQWVVQASQFVDNTFSDSCSTSDTINITLSDNNQGYDTTLSLCPEPNIDLNNLIGVTFSTGGTWYNENNSTIFQPQDYDFSDYAPGNYQFIYRQFFTGNCTHDSIINITINPVNNAGVSIPIIITCNEFG